jgi:hypothetical protein
MRKTSSSSSSADEHDNRMAKRSKSILFSHSLNSSTSLDQAKAAEEDVFEFGTLHISIILIYF